MTTRILSAVLVFFALAGCEHECREGPVTHIGCYYLDGSGNRITTTTWAGDTAEMVCMFKGVDLEVPIYQESK